MYPKFLMLPPGALRPNPWNTNHVSPDNETKLTNSLTNLGWLGPVVVREVVGELEILGGEHRWMVAQSLGHTTIPVMNLGPKSDVDAKKIGLALNARYGVDDAVSLAKLLSEFDDSVDLQSFLPYNNDDIKSIFSSVDIALDKLDLDEDGSETDVAADEPKIAAPPKTHTVMRFQVPLGDSEKIADLIARTTKRQGFTHGSDLQNAGDALVLLLIGSTPAPAADEFPDELDAAPAA